LEVKGASAKGYRGVSCGGLSSASLGLFLSFPYPPNVVINGLPGDAQPLRDLGYRKPFAMELGNGLEAESLCLRLKLSGLLVLFDRITHSCSFRGWRCLRRPSCRYLRRLDLSPLSQVIGRCLGLRCGMEQGGGIRLQHTQPGSEILRVVGSGRS
jgi:hypothetical protein